MFPSAALMNDDLATSDSGDSAAWLRRLHLYQLSSCSRASIVAHVRTHSTHRGKGVCMRASTCSAISSTHGAAHKHDAAHALPWL